MPLEKHVQILGILHIVHSALGLMLGIGLFTLLFGIGIVSQDQTAFLVLGIVGIVIGGFLIFISIPGIIGGIGLLKHRPWARILTLIVGFLKLIDIPLGTALGVYTIWVLMRDESARLFGQAPVSPTPASPLP